MFDDIDEKNNNNDGAKKGVEDIFSGTEPENKPKPFREKEKTEAEPAQIPDERLRKDNIKKILILSGIAFTFILFCFASYYAFIFFTKPQKIDTIIINEGAVNDSGNDDFENDLNGDLDELDVNKKNMEDSEGKKENESLTEDEEEDEEKEAMDADKDGISDYDEINIYKTDPLSSDTDGDGLTDYEEIFTHETDPLSPDTDNDGLSDYEEVHIYKTDPKNPDTDNDGYEDGLEVEGGYNPKGPGTL